MLLHVASLTTSSHVALIPPGRHARGRAGAAEGGRVHSLGWGAGKPDVQMVPALFGLALAPLVTRQDCWGLAAVQRSAGRAVAQPREELVLLGMVAVLGEQGKLQASEKGNQGSLGNSWLLSWGWGEERLGKPFPLQTCCYCWQTTGVATLCLLLLRLELCALFWEHLKIKADFGNNNVLVNKELYFWEMLSLTGSIWAEPLKLFSFLLYTEYRFTSRSWHFLLSH